ncbi:MAG TPA: heme ABC exporter ATP-binding protein CcmA [Acidimicrobiales bacterium]|nr:heme ABC exporter ATP-binding protein CcmA [Acidimicrobiales bacterium]
MASAVCFRSAVVLLDRFPALTGVDLEVDPGEALLVRGPNGAGKTTLLRAIAGLAPVVDGSAEVLGHDLRRDRRAVRRQVGLFGHVTGLYDDLTVAENVRFSIRAAGGDPDGVAVALARVELDGRLASLAVAKLSAGQRRRTALAALIGRRPALWLLDEPHAGLDARGRDLLDEVIADAIATGATVVLASHDTDRAAAVATRTVTMVGGSLEARVRVS